MKTSKKTMFLLYNAACFIYSGVTFLTVKMFPEYIKNIFGNHGIFLAIMTALFVILAAASGAKLNALQHEAEKDPLKAFSVIYHVLYTTFIFATLYFLFNSAVLTIIPDTLSNILTFCDLRLNIPIAALMILFFLKKNGKEAFIKKFPLFAVAAVLIIFELAVSDLIMLVLMVIINSIGLLKGEHQAVDKITLAATVAALILIISMIGSGAWLIAAVSTAITSIILMNEKNYIINLINFRKGAVNYET